MLISRHPNIYEQLRDWLRVSSEERRAPDAARSQCQSSVKSKLHKFKLKLFYSTEAQDRIIHINFKWK